MTDEEFAAAWPRVTGTWAAVRTDAFTIENGAVSRTSSEAMLPQFITMIIDDNEWRTIRRRRGQSETESVDIAVLQQLVRDGNVTLAGEDLYFLMIEVELNSGLGFSRHYTVLSRE